MNGTPENKLLDFVVLLSNCSALLSTGSKLVTNGPKPKVELTSPLVPAPRPPAPRLVPPVAAPDCAPMPPTPPPGGFNTKPTAGPRLVAPAQARGISVSGIFNV